MLLVFQDVVALVDNLGRRVLMVLVLFRCPSLHLAHWLADYWYLYLTHHQERWLGLWVDYLIVNVHLLCVMEKHQPIRFHGQDVPVMSKQLNYRLID